MGDPVRNTCTWMKTTSYGKTKQHLFEGLLLGLILLSTQAQAESIICCEAHNAQCLSCKEGKSIEVYCNKDPFVPGCEEYLSDAIRAPMPMPFGRRLQVGRTSTAGASSLMWVITSSPPSTPSPPGYRGLILMMMSTKLRSRKK